MFTENKNTVVENDNDIMVNETIKTDDSKEINNVLENMNSKKNSKKKSNKQTKECKVVSYTKKTKTLRLLFDNYGVEIKNVDEPLTDIVKVEYSSEIGKPDFKFNLA